MQTLLVLCCHPPSIDPRIKWTAEFGLRGGYSTAIAGFYHTEMWGRKPARASQLVPEKTFSAGDRRLPFWRVLVLMAHARIWPRGWDLLIFAPLAVIGGALWLLWSVWRGAQGGMGFLFQGLRFLPKGQAMINYARHYGRRLSAAIGMLIRSIWRATFGGRFREPVEALRGYHWYFARHAAVFAGCVLYGYEQQETPPDIVHAHDPDALLAAVLMKHRYGCRVIYDAHEYGADAYLIRPKPRYLFHAYERMVVHHADSAVTVSPILAERFNQRYHGRPQFDVLPNASPKTEGAFLRPAQSEITRLAEGRIAILFQGGLSPERGVEWIIDEWALAPPKNAALFVRGPMNAYRDKLIDYARNTTLLGASIYFLDSLSEDLLIAEASVADIGVIPYHSHVENHHGACPNKLSQYMLAGLAVMSSPIPYVQEILRHGQCGVVYNDRLRGDFSRKLRLLLEKADEIRLMGEAGRRYALETYNYENYAGILNRLYRRER